MIKIRAAVCREFNAPLTIETLELPAPEPGEVEVEIKAVAVCHSDISFAEGAWGGRLPAVFGHEAAGVVTEVGAGVAGVAPGDTVIVTLIKSCGSCPTCGKGLPSICGEVRSPAPLLDAEGEKVKRALFCGAFADRAVVDQSQIAKVPETMPMDVAALLACGVITGVGAVVNAAKLQPGEDVVVIGAGGVGLNSIQGAQLAGAARIVAVDLLPEKLEDARAFGATHGVLATDGDPAEAVKDILGKGADAVFVTVGATAVFNASPDYLGPGGRVVLVGIPPSGEVATYAPDIVSSQGQSLIGTKMGDTVLARDIPWLTELYAQGKLELDALISKRWSLDQINEAIADTNAGAARRNVIVF
ncbi:MAG: zinc-binding dehydrogenase [Silicimonas sp.]|nr:zinc-binding dehydrogenase [Silicimonas sp.]